MALPVDAWSARLTATLHIFAHDKKARAGARWLMHAAQSARVEPRIGAITFSQLMQPTQPAHPVAPPIAPEGVELVSRKKKRKTGAQAKLRRLVDYYEAETDEASVWPPTHNPCEPPPLEPDLSPLLQLPPPPAPPSYAAAVLSPVSAAADNGARKEPRAPSPPKQQPAPALLQFSREEIYAFVTDTVATNDWEGNLRSRMLRFKAGGPSFKVKVPRDSRAGDNDALSAEDVTVRLTRLMRSERMCVGARHVAACRKEQIRWLLAPGKPSVTLYHPQEVPTGGRP